MIDYFLSYFASPYGRLLASRIDETWTTSDGYYLISPDAKLEIWIANAAYALRTISKEDWPNNPCGNEYNPGWADRHLIWRAVKRLHLPTRREFELRAAIDSLGSPVVKEPSNEAAVIP